MNTLLAQIVHMGAAAQRSRAPIQRMADQVAAWFVPVVQGKLFKQGKSYMGASRIQGRFA